MKQDMEQGRSSQAPQRWLPLVLGLAMTLTVTKEASAQIQNQVQGPSVALVAKVDAAHTAKRSSAQARSRQSAHAGATRAYEPVKVFEDSTDIPEIEMFVGESRVLPAPGVGRVAVGNGKIMTAAVLDNKEILLFANERGTSSLFIWNEHGKYQRLKINVVAGDTSRVSREIAAFVSRMAGAKVSVVGQNVVVEGDRLSNQDLDKIKRLEKIYPQLLNFTHPEGWEKMVMIDVKVVEFPKNFLRELGLRWTPTGGGTVGAIWLPGRRGNAGPYVVNIPENGGLPITGVEGQPPVLPGSLNILAAINMGFNTTLNALVQDGKAVLLAEPQLSTRSGKLATFDAGGEFPYSVITAEGPSVSFKPYGVRLSINPVVDRDGFIRSEITAEVSAIDAALSTPFGPALRTRKVETHFNVASGQTIILSGMLSAEKSVSADKLPGLGDIPVLGALFRSKRFVNNETELVVFVTPRLVDPHDDKIANRIDDTRGRLQEGLDGRELLEPLKAPDSPKKESPVEVSAETPVTMPSQAASATSDIRPATADTLAEPGGSVLRIKGRGVTLRAQPHARAQPLTVLEEGQLVRLAGASLSASESLFWRQVSVGALLGWVPVRAVEPVAASMGSITYQGQEPTLARRLDEPVSPSKATALIDHSRAASALPAAAPARPDQFRVVLSRLALRVAPDVNAMVLTQIPQGTVLTADDRQTTGLWQPVSFEGYQGWVDVRWIEPVVR